MMEDERNQEQDGTFLVEEGVPEKASATMEENRLQEENAVSAVPSGAGEFPEPVAAAKEEYWNSVLTGDVMTIPREVRQKAEAMYPAGTADRERIAACVMQSWVADSGEIPRERIRRDWKSIREEVARQYGASGKSDDELFVAVSMHNQVRLSQRETLFELYQEEYDRTLAGSGTAPDERRKEAVSAWPEEMQAVADQLKSRAVSDALDDRNRLADAAGIIRRGLEGLVASEAPAPEGFPAVQVNRKAVAGVPDVVRAVDCLASLEDGDRRKVFRMMAPYLRSRPAFRDALGGALKRGAAEAAENVAHLAVNGAAWALPEGREKEALDRYSRSFEELRNFARMEFAPLRGGKDAPWFREMLVDMAQQGASTALAFSGPAGLGLLMAGETGRHMADARRMNPDGVCDAQMGGAVVSGGMNTLLSFGMTKLGQRMLGQGMRAFRAMRSASGNVGAVLSGTGAMAADAVKMAAENKLMELTPMVAQEGVGALTDRVSGVDWEGWKERQMSVDDQLREAAMMMPFLLIGAGKASLHHFRHAGTLLGDGEPLKVFGIPDEAVTRILREKDMRRAGELLQKSLRDSPLWGSLYISRKALEWSRALDEAGEPFLRTEQDVRDFLELPSPVRTKPWKMRDFPESEAVLKKLFPHPDHAAARTKWLLRAGLPRVGESAAADGRHVYEAEPAPGMEMKRTRGRSSVEEALSSWYEALCRMEEEDLGLARNRNGREIPWRLRNAADYDVQADALRRAFVEDRLKKRAYRPYRMLLLAYPEEAGRSGFSGRDWDAVTVEMERRTRANVYEGVMERVHGASHEEVSGHVALRLWESFCRDEGSCARARRWLEEGSSLLNAPDLLAGASGPDGLAAALSRMSGMMASLGDRERHRVSPELREMNRMVWGTQADVNSLYQVLPNMKEFDVHVGRGYTPVESYGRLLSRFLEVEPEHVARYATVLDAPRLHAGPERAVPRVYPGTQKAVENLSRLTPRLFQSSRGSGGGERLWRVKYPNGRWSAWHPSQEAAGADLMANVSMMFSPACTAKRDLIRSWEWHARSGHPEWDTNYLRLTAGLENVQGERLSCLYDSLTAMAVADMLKAGYGVRGAVGSGDRLEVTGRGRVAAETLMSHDALRERMDIHGKYVGDVQRLGVDADNQPVPSAKGLVMHRLRLHNTENPLALIEDKAEVVWDRLMRTDQLSPEDAWEMLKRLGRVPRRRALPGETELIEELSQLSKEYFFAHLDHDAVPETVASWARYGAASPDKALEPLEELVRRAGLLKKTLKEGPETAEFMGMLRETVGMNDRIRAERAWDAGGEEVRLPMMERYAHSLMTGRLLSTAPDHVREDLLRSLAALDGYGGGSVRRMERLAEHRMTELARALQEFPQLNAWRPDPEHPGLYLHLVKRPFKAGKGTLRAKDVSLEAMGELLPEPVLEAPLYMEEDFSVRSGVPAPAAWRSRPEVIRAVETLDVVRRDFAARPEAAESGVIWQGRTYRIDSWTAPEGVATAWSRELPLDEAASLIDVLDRRQEEMRGGMLPFLPDPEEARAMYANCVIYRDPDDPGHTVRLMPGIPESPVRQARAPYVVHAWNGVYLDSRGLPAASERDSYIPLERFTGAGEEPSPETARESRARSLGRILETLGDADAQERWWWNREQAVGCFMEDVVRLYEELGVRSGYLRGELDLLDPVMVQALRFVSHVLNDPLAYRLPLDKGTEALKGMTREGVLLKELVEEHGNF